MKKIIIILVGIIISFSVFSQKKLSLATQTWSNTHEKPGGSDLDKMIEYKNGFITIRRDGDLLLLQKYDANMNETAKKEINYKHKPKKLYYKGIYKVENTFFIVTIHNNKEAGKYNFYTQKVSADDFAVSTPEVLFSITNAEGSLDEAIGISQDSTLLYFMYQKPVADSKPVLELRVYKPNLELLWERTFDKGEFVSYLKETDKSVSIAYSRLSLDYDGDVGIICTVHKKDKTYEKDEPSYYKAIVSITNMGENVVPYLVNLKEKYVKDVFVKWHDDKLFLAGTYQEYVKNKPEDKKTEAHYGSFFSYINTESEEFSETDFQSNDWGSYFSYTDIVFTAKNYYTIGEISYTRIVSRGKTTTTYYVYRDIYINAYDSDMEFAWTSKVDKNQYAQTFNFSSFTYSCVNGELYFIYNDNCKNLELEKNGEGLKAFDKNGYGKNTCVYLAKVNNEGKVDKEIMYNIDDIDALLTMPAESKAFSNGDLVLFVRRKDKFRFVSVKFK